MITLYLEKKDLLIWQVLAERVLCGQLGDALMPTKACVVGTTAG
jgi:hypothetical protein